MRWWRRTLSWRALRACNLVLAVVLFAGAVWEGPSWIALLWAALGGYNLSQASNCTQMMKMQKTFDNLLAIYQQMHEINSELIAGRLAVHVAERDDAPIVPKLH